MKKFLILVLMAVMITGCNGMGEEKTPAVVKPTYDTLDFKLKGVAYTLPLPYKVLEANGWESEQSIDYDIAANSIVKNQYLRNGDNIIKVTFYNDDETTAKPMKDVLIGGIEAENRTFGRDVAVDIVILDGITFQTPIADIERQLGTVEKTSNEVFATYTFKLTQRATTEIKYHLDGQDGNASRWLGIFNYTKYIPKN